MVLDGTWKSTDTWGGMKDGMVVLSPFTNMPDGVDMQMGPTLADAMDNLDPRAESLRAIRNMARTGIPSPVALPVGGTTATVNLAVGLTLMGLAFALLILAGRQARIRQYRR